MKMKKFVFLYILFAAYSTWGQGIYKELWQATHSTETTKSITRACKGNAQITYIQNIEYNPYNSDEIISSTAKFVYYDPSGNEYKVAEFDNSYWPRVTDFEILEDTLYYCGYANIAASSFAPSYMGFVGYFCIPELFAGMDALHSLTFNQQPGTPSAPAYWFVTEPCKIEVFKVRNGIHVICTGGWSSSRSTLHSGGYFIADVVHSFTSNDWWYYIHRDDGIEVFSDVAVTGNYVVSIAPKANLKYFYLRVFTKPYSVGFDTYNGDIDPTIFDTMHRHIPYQSYCFTWTDGLFRDGINCDYLKIAYPQLIHTKGDTIALSYLTYSWLEQHAYGSTVKVIDIADMLHVSLPDPEAGGVPFDPNGGSGGELLQTLSQTFL